MKPNLFVIGAPKCGTTALVYYLSSHPEIYVPNLKEPFFLAPECRAVSYDHGICRMQDYLDLYSKALPEHRYAIDGSTAYLRFQSGIKNALRLSPDAKFIVMLRDPTHLAEAFHAEQVWDQNEPIKDFEQAWRFRLGSKTSCADIQQIKYPFFLDYAKTVDIGAQLKHASELIEPDQLLVLSLMQLRENPADTYRQVLAFLEIADDQKNSFPIVNAAKQHRWPFLAHLILNPPERLAGPIHSLRNALRDSNPAWAVWIKSMLRKPRQKNRLSADFMAELDNHLFLSRARAEALSGLSLREHSLLTYEKPKQTGPINSIRLNHQ